MTAVPASVNGAAAIVTQIPKNPPRERVAHAMVAVKRNEETQDHKQNRKYPKAHTDEWNPEQK